MHRRIHGRILYLLLSDCKSVCTKTVVLRTHLNMLLCQRETMRLRSSQKALPTTVGKRGLRTSSIPGYYDILIAKLHLGVSHQVQLECAQVSDLVHALGYTYGASSEHRAER